MTLTELHQQSLADLEGKRLCSITKALRYVDLSRSKFDELLNARVIKSKYIGHGLRKVEVASLIAYIEGLPIDRPEPGTTR